MKKLTMRVAISALVFGLAAAPAQQQGQKERDTLSERVKAVNDAANKPGVAKTALQAVATETGVPLDQVEAMHKKHSDVGVGGILVAAVIGNETKQPAESFIEKHQSGKGWTELARDSKVPTGKLVEHLEHVEKALASGTGTAEPNNPPKAES